MKKQKIILSSAYAAILTTVFLVVIVVWAELSVPLKNWLANFSGHHWTSKSIFSVLLYAGATVLFFLMPQRVDEDRLKKGLGMLIVFVLLGTLAITLFFTGHHFKIF